MFSLKKTALVVLALGGSAAFAGTMGPVCAPGNVTVPCERNAWDFGAQALYLQPTFNSGWAYIERTSVPISLAPFAYSVQDYQQFNPDWDWGFQIEGSYHFNTGNDLTINWYHLETGDDFYGPYAFFAGLPVTPTFNHLVASNTRWDAVNAEFAQFTDFSASTKIRFHGGAQYANIKANVSNSSIESEGLTSISGYAEAHSAFSGFGPRAGADVDYLFSNVSGFGLYAKAAAAVLIGTSKFNNSQIGILNVGGGEVPIFATNATDQFGSRRTMVPELEGKLGGHYTYAMAQGDLTLDAGYMWVNYFNALDNTYNNGVFPSTGVSAGVSPIAETDFALSGPYIGLKYVGNV